MVNIPWYADLFLLFLPLLFSTVIGLWINVLLRRINRQEGNPPWTIRRTFLMACIVSSPLAALTQILLQAVLAPYILIEEGTSMVVFDAVMSPFLVLLTYNIALWYFNKKNWYSAYTFIRVKHSEIIDYADDVSDFTVKNYHSSSLNGNDKKEE